jgi:para-aminobenzoate synthetase/4-amino-4-deoxychorismate lyase
MATLQPAASEFLFRAPRQDGWLYFPKPEKIFAIFDLEQVLPVLQAVETAVENNQKFAAGWVSYEAAPAFDHSYQVKKTFENAFPLLWLAIYPTAVYIPDSAITIDSSQLPGPWQADLTKTDFRKAIRKIKTYIAKGATYQVNYTYRLRSSFNVPAWPLFASLSNAHVAPYTAFLETEEFAVCSLSPELFFDLEGETITSRPMKGTARRGRTLAEDNRMAAWLRHSVKNRAENVMIVDMMRNDIGKIAHPGSVCVPELFTVEKYPTVWQMTSTVQGKTSASLAEIFGALFPAASITGAPKIRTMQMITELEASPRKIYTGAIGYYAPGRKACFNVAIRTLWIDKIRQQVEYGVGGGIVWDSRPMVEWEETKTKARLLEEIPQPFALLETLRWSPEGGWFLLHQHLKRLKSSANYFSYPVNISEIRSRLFGLEKSFPKDEAQRVRLTVRKNGEICVEYQGLLIHQSAYRVNIAKKPINSSERFLYHKTTRREIYEKARAEIADCDDVLMWNEHHEITESSIANVVVEQDGNWYTPPVKCGLLPGIYRAWLLDQKKVQEQIINLDNLFDYERIFLVNSVRGMWEIKLKRS